MSVGLLGVTKHFPNNQLVALEFGFYLLGHSSGPSRVLVAAIAMRT